MVLDINVLGTFRVNKYAVEHMVKNEPIDGERGCIINISSVAGEDGQMG